MQFMRRGGKAKWYICPDRTRNLYGLMQIKPPQYNVLTAQSIAIANKRKNKALKAPFCFLFNNPAV